MITYRSPFDRWERAAAVRRFSIDALDWSNGGQWAPAGHLALIEHPAIEGLLHGAGGAALILGHFHFTAKLESELIAPVCNRIVASNALLAEDALRVQCDESYHALACLQLSRRVCDAAGIDRPQFGEPRFLRHVQALHETAGPCVAAEDIDFAAAVVSETIVTRTLGEDWRDPLVHSAIRSFLKMHHRDEARHGAFFAQALALRWQEWGPVTREAIEAMWDGLVDAFIGPDLAMMAAAFAVGKVEPGLAHEILGALGAASERLAPRADTRLTRRTLAAAKAATGLGVAA